MIASTGSRLSTPDTRSASGTRHRGATPEEDAALEAELLADPKERAEHLMLLDLGRNDMGEPCMATPAISQGSLFIRTRDMPARSYLDTLDCPALCGLRTTADVLESHKHAGAWDPAIWWIIQREGRPEGCMLLSETAEHDAVELVYIGLGPEARGEPDRTPQDPAVLEADHGGVADDGSHGLARDSEDEGVADAVAFEDVHHVGEPGGEHVVGRLVVAAGHKVEVDQHRDLGKVVLDPRKGAPQKGIAKAFGELVQVGLAQQHGTGLL